MPIPPIRKLKLLLQADVFNPMIREATEHYRVNIQAFVPKDEYRRLVDKEVMRLRRESPGRYIARSGKDISYLIAEANVQQRLADKLARTNMMFRTLTTGQLEHTTTFEDGKIVIGDTTIENKGKGWYELVNGPARVKVRASQMEDILEAGRRFGPEAVKSRVRKIWHATTPEGMESKYRNMLRSIIEGYKKNVGFEDRIPAMEELYAKGSIDDIKAFVDDWYETHDQVMIKQFFNYMLDADFDDFE